MTSTKWFVLGFLFIALGFGFFLMALTGTDNNFNGLSANLFAPIPAPGAPNVLNIANAVRLEQGIGLAAIIVGFLVGLIGCFRKN